MLSNDYYYNATTKKVIAVFGSIFNDITIGRLDADGNRAIEKVPLSYAPHERYLTLLNGEQTIDRPAIILPRMTFEITSLTADPEKRLNRLNKSIQCAGDNMYSAWQSAPYEMEITLKIMSRGHDEALQIIEQIFPFFNPTYTITVKGMEGPDSKTDLPITLTGSNIEDSYAGAYESSRRLIIYTLTFNLPIKYMLPVDDLGVGGENGGIIKSVHSEILQCGTGEFMSAVHVRTRYADATIDDHEVVCVLGALPYEETDPIWDERP